MGGRLSVTNGLGCYFESNERTSKIVGHPLLDMYSDISVALTETLSVNDYSCMPYRTLDTMIKPHVPHSVLCSLFSQIFRIQHSVQTSTQDIVMFWIQDGYRLWAPRNEVLCFPTENQQYRIQHVYRATLWQTMLSFVLAVQSYYIWISKHTKRFVYKFEIEHNRALLSI